MQVSLSNGTFEVYIVFCICIKYCLSFGLRRASVSAVSVLSFSVRFSKWLSYHEMKGQPTVFSFSERSFLSVKGKTPRSV